MGLTSQQAAGMGGAGKPAGMQADNTFQNKEVRQLVMLVRYKPKPPEDFGDQTVAAGMLSGVTGAVDGVVGAAEGAMANIPGLDMFIKEKKTDSTSDKEYVYDYSDWDSAFSRLGPDLVKMNPESKADTFEFSSTDTNGRKSDAQELFAKVNSKMAGWSNYTVWIHFIGIGQGGHVVNECTDLLAKDDGFKSEAKRCVKSVIYVGTSIFKNEQILNTNAFKGQGQAISFGSAFDLTQHAVNYFEPNETLVQMIKDSNKNTLSLPVGKVKVRIIRIVSLFLGGMSLSIGHVGDLHKIDMIKDEITGMIDDITGFIKKAVTDTASFIQLGKLPEFGKMMDGLGTIPDECRHRLGDFFDHFTRDALHQVEHANITMTPASLAEVLNCFCPLFDHITKAMSLFTYESKTSVALAQQIIDNAGVNHVYVTGDSGYTDLSKLDPYYQKFIGKVNDPKPDMAMAYVSQAKSLIAQAAVQGIEIKDFTDDQKIALAEGIYLLARPMTLSKEEVYKELLTLSDSYVNYDAISQKITTNKLTDIPAGPLQSLGVGYPPELQASIAKNNDQVSRIKGYFNKNNFGMQEDSQYLIFNSHNALCTKMPDAVAFCLDQQTTFVDYQRSVRMDNEFATTGKNKYNPAGGQQNENVMPAQPLPA